MITGTGFAATPSLSFENGSGPNPRGQAVVFVSSTQIEADVEIRSGGPPRVRSWDVRVTNPDGTSAVGAGLLTINP